MFSAEKTIAVVSDHLYYGNYIQSAAYCLCDLTASAGDFCHCEIDDI